MKLKMPRLSLIFRSLQATRIDLGGCMKGKAKLKTTTSLVLNIVLYIFLAICVLSVTITLISQKEDDGAELFGYQMRIVTSESMAKCDETDVSGYEIGSIPLNSMVFIETVPDDAAKAAKWYSEIKVGDVLTFKYKYTSHVTITHRVTDIAEKPSGGYIITLAGDNKTAGSKVTTQIIDTSEDPRVAVNYIIGKVTAKSFLFGLLLSFLQKPVGIVLIIIIPCFVIIMMEVFKIIGVVNEDKKKKELEEKRQKDSEIEELRRKLAELENIGVSAEKKSDAAPVGEEG